MSWGQHLGSHSCCAMGAAHLAPLDMWWWWHVEGDGRCRKVHSLPLFCLNLRRNVQVGGVRELSVSML